MTQELPTEALTGLADEELYDQLKVSAAIGAMCGALRGLTVVEAMNAMESVRTAFRALYVNEKGAD